RAVGTGHVVEPAGVHLFDGDPASPGLFDHVGQRPFYREAGLHVDTLDPAPAGPQRLEHRAPPLDLFEARRRLLQSRRQTLPAGWSSTVTPNAASRSRMASAVAKSLRDRASVRRFMSNSIRPSTNSPASPERASKVRPNT